MDSNVIPTVAHILIRTRAFTKVLELAFTREGDSPLIAIYLDLYAQYIMQEDELDICPLLQEQDHSTDPTLTEYFATFLYRFDAFINLLVYFHLSLFFYDTSNIYPLVELKSPTSVALAVSNFYRSKRCYSFPEVFFVSVEDVDTTAISTQIKLASAAQVAKYSLHAVVSERSPRQFVLFIQDPTGWISIDNERITDVPTFSTEAVCLLGYASRLSDVGVVRHTLSGPPAASPPAASATPRPSTSPAVSERVSPYIRDFQRLQLVQTLGKSVGLFEDPSTHERIAVKSFGPTSGLSSEFFRDTDELVRLSHPCVLRIVGYCPATQTSLAQIGTEFASGGSLREAVRRLDDTGKAIVVVGIVVGMRYIHSRGIVHQDLKPENILLDERDYPKIGDVGNSRFCDLKLRIANGSRTGLYIAPEMYQDQDWTPAVDVYSFALIFYEVFAGREAFVATSNPAAVMKKVVYGYRPSLPSSIDRTVAHVITQAWSGAPAARGSFDDIFDALRRIDFKMTPAVDSGKVTEFLAHVDASVAPQQVAGLKPRRDRTLGPDQAPPPSDLAKKRSPPAGPKTGVKRARREGKVARGDPDDSQAISQPSSPTETQMPEKASPSESESPSSSRAETDPPGKAEAIIPDDSKARPPTTRPADAQKAEPPVPDDSAKPSTAGHAGIEKAASPQSTRGQPHAAEAAKDAAQRHNARKLPQPGPMNLEPLSKPATMGPVRKVTADAFVLILWLFNAAEMKFVCKPSFNYATKESLMVKAGNILCEYRASDAFYLIDDSRQFQQALSFQTSFRKVTMVVAMNPKSFKIAIDFMDRKTVDIVLRCYIIPKLALTVTFAADQKVSELFHFCRERLVREVLKLSTSAPVRLFLSNGPRFVELDTDDPRSVGSFSDENVMFTIDERAPP
jgi:serine/threonine protein kinase